MVQTFLPNSITRSAGDPNKAINDTLTRTLCAAATILHTSAPPTRPPPTPAGAAATGKGAHKMRCCARTLRRPAHGPCPHPPQPAPLSPPDAHATLVPGPVAALSPRPRARCRLRIGALYLPQQEDWRTLCAPSGACYAPHDLNSCVGPAHLMCILTRPGASDRGAILVLWRLQRASDHGTNGPQNVVPSVALVPKAWSYARAPFHTGKRGVGTTMELLFILGEELPLALVPSSL